MRYAIVIHEYPPIGGGAATAASQIAREWVRAGHEVLVLTAGDRTCARNERIDGVSVERLQLRKTAHFAPSAAELAAFSCIAACKFTARLKSFRADAILAFFMVPAGFFAVRSARSLSIPVAVSLRGSDVPGFSSERLGGVSGLISRPFMRWTLQHADFVVPNSAILRDLTLEEFPETRDKMEIVRNGIEPSMLAEQAAASKKSELRIVQVGQLIGRKRVDMTIHALASLRKRNLTVRLTVIGTGPKLEGLRELANSQGVADLVDFQGFVPRGRLPEILRRHDVYIATSRAEGMSNALLEAMACGLPVITTENGSHDIVNEAGCGMIVLGSEVESLVGLIAKISSLPEERQRMGMAGIRFAREHTWTDCANRFADLIERAREKDG